MSKKKPKDTYIDEPMEEFIHDSPVQHIYEDWSLEDLRQEAESRKIPDGRGMEKNELIQKLKSSDAK